MGKKPVQSIPTKGKQMPPVKKSAPQVVQNNKSNNKKQQSKNNQDSDEDSLNVEELPFDVNADSDEEDEDEDEDEEDDESQGSEEDADEAPEDDDEEMEEDEVEGEDMEVDEVEGEEDDEGDAPAKRLRIAGDEFHYDLYNLTVCNFNPFSFNNASSDEERNEILRNAATQAVQKLYEKLHELPKESSEAGPLLVLPAKEVIDLPRFKKIPGPKPETKWEKFAREKGIQNKKRDRMLYDESTGEYVPRFGYKGANQGIRDIPIVEVKAGQDPFADPWADERASKKDRVKKNEKNQLKNLGRIAKKRGDYDPGHVPGIPIDIKGVDKKRGKDGVRKALQLAQHSTASMGRYDELKSGEPKIKLAGKKNAFRDNTLPLDVEKQAMKSQLRFLTDRDEKKKKGVTNSLSAYEGIIPDAPTLKFKKEKGRGKNAMVASHKPKGKKK